MCQKNTVYLQIILLYSFKVRKFLAVLLVILYVGVSTGVAINYHYCMDKLAEVSLFMSDESDSCPNCGMDDSSGGCCSNETKTLRISIDQNLVEQINLGANLSYVVAVLYDMNFSLLPSESTSDKITFYYSSPPDVSRQPLFIRNCTFLI